MFTSMPGLEWWEFNPELPLPGVPPLDPVVWDLVYPNKYPPLPTDVYPEPKE